MDQQDSFTELNQFEGESSKEGKPQNEDVRDLEVLEDRVSTLEMAAKRFEDLFHGLPVACYSYDAESRIQDWNDAASELWGLQGYQVVQKTVCETLFPEAEHDVRRSVIARVMQGQSVEYSEVTALTAIGEPRWILTCDIPQYSADGKVIGGLSACIDISDKMQAEAALAESENLLRTAYEVLQNGVVIIDEDLRVLVCNPSACEILGIEESDFVGKKLTNEVFTPLHQDGTPMKNEDLPSFRSLKNGEFCKDIVMGIKRVRDNETIWINVKSSPIIPNGSTSPTGAVACFSDITQRLAHVQMIEQNLQQISDLNVVMEIQQMELEFANGKLERANDMLENLANNDGLTGVANHRAFQDNLDRQMEISKKTGHSLSLLIIDVDNFKSFNDDFGHQIGDDVLIEVASVISGSARADDFSARYGGEEFVVILPQTSELIALNVAERMRECIENHGWSRRAVTVSIGVATLAQREIAKDILIEEADRALYASKHAGRNRSTHFSSLADDASQAA